MIQKEEIKRYYQFLGHKHITEIRICKPNWAEKKFVQSFFVKNVEEFIQVCEKYTGEFNIYAGINERKNEGKSDDDVNFITHIGHDIDCHDDPSKLGVAGQIAIDIMNDSKKIGYKEPLILNSGHGYWVIHKIEPIENTDDAVKKIKEFGNRIKEKYEKDGVELDSTVYNPSRISRVPGTLNLRDKDNFIFSTIVNTPEGTDGKLRDDILDIEIKTYSKNLNAKNVPTVNSFMDYCLTHEIPKGERHSVISRNMAIYISDHPDRELLKEQYYKIQKGSSGELDQYLKNIDKNGKDKYPFSIGQMVNFTKKYKIPFDWKSTPEYKTFIKEKKAEKKLAQKVESEKTAERLGKSITSFYGKLNLAEQFIKIQPLFYDKSKMWWIWNHDEKYWGLSDETEIINYISKHSEANTISSKERGEILESLRQRGRLNMPKPTKKNWIQFKNQIYDLETDEIFEATPEYFVTNPIPWELSEETETPIMDKIFEEWVGKDYVKTLYQIIAYCLLPDYPLARIFTFIGEGMNGKSCYLNIVKKFLGDHNITSTDLERLLNGRFEITRLHKKLGCLLSETNFSEMRQTAKLKQLTGNDLMAMEYKGKDNFDAVNYAKILISTNSLPITNDKTLGFYRRWLIIDFFNRFSEAKDVLADIPEEEYNNLALKSIENLKELMIKRKFHNEGSLELRQKRYEDMSNPLDKFIKEFTTEDFNQHIWKFEFEKRLNEWCREKKFREMSDMSIGKKMKQLGYYQEKKMSDWLIDGQNKQLRCWIGLKWK